MRHRICIFVAGVMIALSIFLSFDRITGYSPLRGRWLPRDVLIAPETSAIPAEYSCEEP
jgi:hypothetical protein